MVRGLQILALLAIGSSKALACSPLPESMAARLYDQTAKSTDKRTSSLVEIVITKSAKFPEIGSARVVRTHWGKLRPGTILKLQPQPGSMCGPEEIQSGDKGLVRFSVGELSQPHMIFYGFAKPLELNAYRRHKLLKD